MKNLRLIIILLLSITITMTGCSRVRSVLKSNNQPTLAQRHINQSAEEYLHLAASATPPRQQTYQLLAAKQLLRDHKLTRAQQVVNTINTRNLPAEIIFEKDVLNAKILLAKQQPQQALHKLQALTIPDALSIQNQVDYHETLADIHAGVGNVFASIYQRNMLDDLLKNKHARERNQLNIWTNLQKLPAEQLNQWLSEPLTPNLRGWFSLAKISQDATSNPDQFAQNLSLWRTNFPMHPGNTVLPESKKSNTNKMLAQQPHNIYLLLPLSGKFGENGRAIRNGFMAAYYAYQSQSLHPPAVHIIDTSDGDIVDHYQRAVRENADFIVGPLTKTNITELTQAKRLEVPTLALSDISGLIAPNLYHFGLSQHNEALQVATRAFQDGHQHAIIIAPETNWGQAVANQFAERWRTLGGVIVDRLAYNNSKASGEDIRKLLRVDNSESRAKDLQIILKQNLRFVPRRRQDVDMIFLVSNSSQAKNIMPMLKFYYADNLPVYSTSIVYNGTPDKQQDNDLDQIQFAEMPWVLNNLPKELQMIQQQTKSTWKTAYLKKPKMYALGVDAFYLSSRINQMDIFPHLGINGATGTLYLAPNKHVFRELAWAKMKNGKPLLLH